MLYYYSNSILPPFLTIQKMDHEDINSVAAIQQIEFEEQIDICSNDDWTTTTSKSKTTKKVKDDDNKKIPGHHRIKIKTKNDIFKVDLFETGYQPGLNIRNAISGSYYNHKTGTFDEHLYFKVIDTCYSGKNPYLLFYESPEQFERHYICNVSKETKRKWLERYNAEIEKRKMENIKQ